MSHHTIFPCAISRRAGNRNGQTVTTTLNCIPHRIRAVLVRHNLGHVSELRCMDAGCMQSEVSQSPKTPSCIKSESPPVCNLSVPCPGTMAAYEHAVITGNSASAHSVARPAAVVKTWIGPGDIMLNERGCKDGTACILGSSRVLLGLHHADGVTRQVCRRIFREPGED